MAKNETPFDPKEAQYNELIDYSHYLAVNELRSKFDNHEDSDVEEELFAIAHFMVRHSAWDPYKQSFLAIALMEKLGSDATDMWDKILTPLEKAYERSSGVSFKDKFGFEYMKEKEEAVDTDGGSSQASSSGNPNKRVIASTRKHALEILTHLSQLSKEAGQLQDTPEQAKQKGVLTPLQRAEREAKRKLVEQKVEAARKAQAEAEMAAMEAEEGN